MYRLAQAVVFRPHSDRRAFFNNGALILLFLLPVLLYLPVLGTPFERDESVYATIARGLLRGDVPYRDLFDNKPPLVFGWYALSFVLFGENDVAPRLVAAMLLSLTTLALFAEAGLLFSRRVAYLAAAAFALSTGLPFVALHANTEAYMLLPLVTSLLAFTMGMRSGRLGWFLAAGALGALAVMTETGGSLEPGGTGPDGDSVALSEQRAGCRARGAAGVPGGGHSGCHGAGRHAVFRR